MGYFGGLILVVIIGYFSWYLHPFVLCEINSYLISYIR